MRLSLRFIIPLLVVLAAFAYAVLPLVDNLTLRWFKRDIEIRARLIATADDLGKAHFDSDSGYGKLNAYRALKWSQDDARD